MTEKKTAISVSVIGIITLCGFALYISTVDPVSKIGLPNSNSNVEYGASSALSNSNSNILGASVEYKAGAVNYFENTNIEQN